jgi:hypothetical protein
MSVINPDYVRALELQAEHDEQDIAKLQADLALEKQKCKEIVQHTCNIADETGWVCLYVQENQQLQAEIEQIKKNHQDHTDHRNHLAMVKAVSDHECNRQKEKNINDTLFEQAQMLEQLQAELKVYEIDLEHERARL